jgi:hypothetical protein
MIKKATIESGRGVDQTTEKQIANVGRRIGEFFRAVLESIPNAPNRAVELSKFLRIDKTLSVRLMGAIKKQDPLAICHGVPGPRGLRTMLAASEQKGAAPDALAQAEHSVQEFEAIVRELGGSRSAFNTIISSLLPDVRERIERRNKKAAFDAMSNLFGFHTDASFVACLVQPAEKGGNACDSVCFAGKVGMRHIMPRVARTVWAQKCTAPSWETPAVSCNLDRVPVASDQVPIIKEFCGEPLPEFKLFTHKGSNYVALAGDEVPSSMPTNLFIGSYTPGTFLRYRTVDTTTEFVSYTASEPARVAFIDVFIHEEAWPDANPRLALYRTGPRGNIDFSGEREFDRIDMIETVRFLGKGTDRIHTNDVENYAAMVRKVFDRVGWDGERFRAYRVRIEYPLLHSQVMLTFDLPEKGHDR